MKTIEEESKEMYGNHPHKYACQREGFVKGVEFAQRWIPITEELPESIKVIAKLKNDTFMIANMMNGTLLTEQIEYFGITHWRPIELK